MKALKGWGCLGLLALSAGAGCVADGSLGIEDDGTNIPGSIQPPIDDQGIVFVSHFYEDSISQQNILQWYDVNGAIPQLSGQIDIGATSHSMALDKENELMAVVSDTARKVALFDLAGVKSGEEPRLASALDFSENVPLFADFDWNSNRLYVSAAPISDSIATENFLYVYDVANPAAPELIAGAPFSIPVTASWGLDPFRDVLWLVDFRTKELLGYDVLPNQIEQIPGGRISIKELYPEDNQNTFQIRDLTVDPWRNRLYAARSQGALSELIAFEYPSDLPKQGQQYGQLVSMGELTKIEDALDVGVSPDSRPTLLDAYEVALNDSTGEVFMSAAAWNGRSVSGVVASFSFDLSEFSGGCAPNENEACWIERVNELGATKRQTDGAICAGTMVAATSVAEPETDPGFMHFFAKNQSNQWEHALNNNGESIRASSFPISALCF